MDIVYDCIVVGRGLMGTAAARYLSSWGHRVALVGPGEPPDRQTHSGVFASHYDEGRITRILDPDLQWAQFAQRSIARYRALEQQTGIRFYQEVGHLAVGERQGESAAYLSALETTADQLDVPVECLERQTLQGRFPYFSFSAAAVGLYQRRQAGYISPRRHVAAQSRAVELNGGAIIDEVAHSVHASEGGVAVDTETQSLSAKAGIIAAGGFAQACGLLPANLPLTVQGRTILLALVSEADLPALEGMPSLIHKGSQPASRFYLLPPIQYPDGNWYIKIGCSEATPLTDDLAALQSWFKSAGNAATGEHLQTLLTAVVPEVSFASFQTETCVTTHTPSGYPIIDWMSSGRWLSLVGGNGYAGKSADELGLIAAQRLCEGFPTTGVSMRAAASYHSS